TCEENRGVPVLESLGYAFLGARSREHRLLFCRVAAQAALHEPGQVSPVVPVGCPVVRVNSHATFQSGSSSFVGAGISAWPTLNCLSRCASFRPVSFRKKRRFNARAAAKTFRKRTAMDI